MVSAVGSFMCCFVVVIVETGSPVIQAGLNPREIPLPHPTCCNHRYEPYLFLKLVLYLHTHVCVEPRASYMSDNPSTTEPPHLMRVYR